MHRWQIGKNRAADEQALEMAGALLRSGGLVAFPTETVYGLGANAFDEAAVKRVFAAKNRPVDNPLIVHIADIEQLTSLLPDEYVPTVAHKRLMQAFWPGPLTLLFPAGAAVAPSVHPGLTHVGVRLPDHPLAQQLIRRSQCAIAAPSANLSGRPSPTTADAVVEDVGARIDGLVDGGACGIGVESTVLLVEDERAVILRPGGVTQKMLADVLDVPVVYAAHLFETNTAPLAPGMKYRHYAPNARVHVWWGEQADIYAAMRTFLAAEDDDEAAQAVAIIAPDDFLSRYDLPVADSAKARLDGSSYETVLARELFHLLRKFDHVGATDILIHGVNPTYGLGTAVMNRLQKAAEGRVYHV